MERIQKKQYNHRQLLKLTSLEADEFFSVLAVFDQLWYEQHRHYDLKGQERNIPKFKEHADISLQGSDDKLLFVLVYLSEHPSQQYHAAIFNMSQSKVSHGVARRWLKLLLPLLEKTLSKMKLLPARNADTLYQSLQLLAGYFILLDGTERPIPRPVCPDRREYFYSGKKGCHTVKNNLIINESKQVLYLSPTVEGKLHDKTLAQEMELHFPSQGVLMQDLGYQGFFPEHVTVVMPIKKSKGRKLTQKQKDFNKRTSSMRIAVEHAIGSVKRLNILQHKIRLRIEDIKDQIMLIATGLHNLRVANRNLS